ncbi:hypothetical protein GUJ93_ZPchr0011g27518 [Zizania palustris]|uniref:Uncharacterized protein n=1 Tax=Zizania palustris TaxID=103762 RepID=A0A8J6BKC4_ZIZPA|nr:hypothetical protein GUJ93_ZPchr0011g27518 [Zizania palustris]
MLSVAEELLLKGALDMPRGGVRGENFLKEVTGDGAVEPAEDDTVHLGSIHTVGMGVVGEDMARQGVLAEDDEEETAPSGVVGGGDVEGHRYKRLDVEDADSLSVEGDQGVDIERRC